MSFKLTPNKCPSCGGAPRALAELCPVDYGITAEKPGEYDYSGDNKEWDEDSRPVLAVEGTEPGAMDPDFDYDKADRRLRTTPRLVLVVCDLDGEGGDYHTWAAKQEEEATSAYYEARELEEAVDREVVAYSDGTITIPVKREVR